MLGCIRLLVIEQDIWGRWFLCERCDAIKVVFAIEASKTCGVGGGRERFK